MIAPKCDCHGIEKKKCGRKKDGSQKWTCAILKKEQSNRWNNSEKSKLAHRRYDKKYPEKKAKRIENLRMSHEEKMEIDVLYRMKYETKHWLRGMKTGRYV